MTFFIGQSFSHFLSMLETEPRVSRMPSKHCPADLYPQPCTGISEVQTLRLKFLFGKPLRSEASRRTLFISFLYSGVTVLCIRSYSPSEFPGLVTEDSRRSV